MHKYQPQQHTQLHEHVNLARRAGQAVKDNRLMARPCVLAIVLDKSMHIRTAHVAVFWPSTARG